MSAYTIGGSSYTIGSSAYVIGGAMTFTIGNTTTAGANSANLASTRQRSMNMAANAAVATPNSYRVTEINWFGTTSTGAARLSFGLYDWNGSAAAIPPGANDLKFEFTFPTPGSPIIAPAAVRTLTVGVDFPENIVTFPQGFALPSVKSVDATVTLYRGTDTSAGDCFFNGGLTSGNPCQDQYPTDDGTGTQDHIFWFVLEEISTDAPTLTRPLTHALTHSLTHSLTG